MPYVVYLVALFVALMTGGIWFILRYQRARKKKLADRIFYMKTFGQKIHVPLKSCKIVHRRFGEGDDVQSDVCLLTYQTAIKGKDRLFKSPPLYLAPDELQRLLDRQKTAVIFYDTADPDHHYFELPFLSEFIR